MRRTYLPALAFLVLLVAPLAGAQQDPLQGHTAPHSGHEIPFAIYTSQLGGEPRSAIVNGEQLGNSPNWSPESNEPPPVSIKDAVDLSREVVHALVPDLALWRLDGVRFDRVNKYWLYVVRWELSTGASKDYLQIPVMLSGRVVLLAPKGTSEQQQ
jgi:hypothetical protein